MKQPCQESLGQYLRRERESRQISLPELSRTTRISLPFLKALEEDNLDFFSQDEFILGFLRLYARHLGLDAQHVLQRYEFQSEIHRRKKAFQQLPIFLDFNSPIEKAPGRSWDPAKRFKQKIILVSIFVMAMGLFLYTHFLPERSPNPGTPGSPLSGNIGQENPGEKIALLSPVGPAEKESLPRRMPDPPEINAPGRESEAKMEGDASEKTIPPRQQKVKVIGNRDSKRYHLPGMKYYDKVLAYHRVEFHSEEEAIRAGYHKARH